MKIKFKAWDREDKDMLDWLTISQYSFNSMGSKLMYDVLKDSKYCTLLYTYREDKNGNDIYEGDILEAPNDSNYRFGKRCIVEYMGDDAAFGLIGIDHFDFHILDSNIASTLTIIGNRFENPELL